MYEPFLSDDIHYMFYDDIYGQNSVLSNVTRPPVILSDSRLLESLEESAETEYNAACDTALYYFMEEIVLWEPEDEFSDEIPFGAFDIYSYLEERGVKLPAIGHLEID